MENRKNKFNINSCVLYYNEEIGQYYLVKIYEMCYNCKSDKITYSFETYCTKEGICLNIPEEHLSMTPDVLKENYLEVIEKEYQYEHDKLLKELKDRKDKLEKAFELKPLEELDNDS